MIFYRRSPFHYKIVNFKTTLTIIIQIYNKSQFRSVSDLKDVSKYRI